MAHTIKPYMFQSTDRIANLSNISASPAAIHLTSHLNISAISDSVYTVVNPSINISARPAVAN